MPLFGQYPPGIQRRTRVGDGVVHVQQVERHAVATSTILDVKTSS